MASTTMNIVETATPSHWSSSVAVHVHILDCIPPLLEDEDDNPTPTQIPSSSSLPVTVKQSKTSSAAHTARGHQDGGEYYEASSSASALLDIHHEETPTRTRTRQCHQSQSKGDVVRRKQKKRRGRRRYIHDEHATVYIISQSQGDDNYLTTKLRNVLGDGNPTLCRLFRKVCRDHDTSTATATAAINDNGEGAGLDDSAVLWVPVILRILHKPPLPFHGTTIPTNNCNSSNNRQPIPKLYIPPCLAATIGIHGFHPTNNNQSSSNYTTLPAYLQRLEKDCIVKATHATLQEIGLPPPIARLKQLQQLLPKPASSSYLEDGSTEIKTNDGGTSGNVVAQNSDLLESKGHDDKTSSSSLLTNNTGLNQQQAAFPMEPSMAEEQLRKFFLTPSTNHKYNDRNNKKEVENRNNDLYYSLHPSIRQKHHSTTTKKKHQQLKLVSKPRQRLFAVGSIFATPIHNNDETTTVRFYQIVDIQQQPARRENTVDDTTAGVVVSQKSNTAYIVSPSTHLVLLPTTTHSHDNDDDNHSKGVVLLHPQLNKNAHNIMMNGYKWRIPRPSLALSFLKSIIIEEQQADRNGMLVEKKELQSAVSSSCSRSRSSSSSILHHPSAKELVDALYLQGVIPGTTGATSRSGTCGVLPAKQCSVCHSSSSIHPQSGTESSLLGKTTLQNNRPRIIHLIGKEENHVKACIDEAADIMGMRSFHVDGLAAFWAHYNLFSAYSNHQTFKSDNSRSPSLTGGLADKLRGLSAAIEIARGSSPCVLHISGIDAELSPTEGHTADLDARREEEQRMMEVIRQGCCSNGSEDGGSLMHNMDEQTVSQDSMFLSNATAPQLIIVVSTTNPLPSGPISSSLQQSSIVLSPPDINYARVLWDKDKDGTFDSIEKYLVGLSARDICYLRELFVSYGVAGMVSTTKESNKGPSRIDNLTSASAVDVIQSFLPHLEATSSFTQSSRKGGGSGSSTMPLSSTSLPSVKWQDIGGLESIRKEIMDAVELPLKYPSLFQGTHRRSGILLFGPPGTGKTLVAKAVANECGLPFLSIKGPELLGSYVGESEANIRGVFEAARAAAMDPPTSSLRHGVVDSSSSGYSGASVLFFDELDSLAPRRGEMGHGDGVMDRVVATLLGELDNGGGDSGDSKRNAATDAHVIVIGATNRPDLLDPSLLRPGRFDRLLYLGPAKTKEHCLQILLAQTRKFKFKEGYDATSTLDRAMESFPPTLSGADLSAVASGALMQGLKRVCEQIEKEVKDDTDVDDVMKSWSKEQLQPKMIVEDFVEAAKRIVPSISKQDLENFERLQRQFSSGQY